MRLIDADALLESTNEITEGYRMIFSPVSDILRGCIMALDLVERIVKDAPTIDPESLRPQWIPCSERLPTKVGEYNELHCPFCGGRVRIVVCDDEGNYPKEDGYENDPWSGLGYLLCHSEDDAIGDCPIARAEGEDLLGRMIYSSPEEAIDAWTIMPEPYNPENGDTK